MTTESDVRAAINRLTAAARDKGYRKAKAYLDFLPDYIGGGVIYLPEGVSVAATRDTLAEVEAAVLANIEALPRRADWTPELTAATLGLRADGSIAEVA